MTDESKPDSIRGVVVGEDICAQCGKQTTCANLGDEGWTMCAPCLRDVLELMERKGP